MEEDGSQSTVGTSKDSKSLEQRQLYVSKVRVNSRFEKTELLKSTFDIDSESIEWLFSCEIIVVTAIGWKDQYVGIISRKSILHCEISPNGLLNHQMIDIPEPIDVRVFYSNNSC